VYLDALGDQLVEVGDEPGSRLLHDLVRRLRALEAYLADDNLPDAACEVYCGGRAHDLRSLFAPADAFDDLPVIPIFAGLLGETTDWQNGVRSFVYGLKLKLNGPLERFDKLSSFEYHLAQLRRRYPPSQSERLVCMAVLYAVAVPRLGDASYDPIEYLRETLLPALQSGQAGQGGPHGHGDSEDERDTVDGATRLLCRQIATACEPSAHSVSALAASLRRLLRRETRRARAVREGK